MIKTYMAKTGNNEVRALGQIRVEETETIEKKSTLTIEFVQRQIDSNAAQVKAYLAKGAELEAKLKAMKTVASTITLKTKATNENTN